MYEGEEVDEVRPTGLKYGLRGHTQECLGKCCPGKPATLIRKDERLRFYTQGCLGRRCPGTPVTLMRKDEVGRRCENLRMGVM
jgi:hypothetical protein